MAYKRKNLVYQSDNKIDESSRFNFIRRWHLERTVLNHSRFSKNSMFLFAYRAYIEALGTQNKETLRKMSEPRLYSRLIANFENMNKFNMH